MFRKEKVLKVIDRGIEFLETQQEKRGNFISLSFSSLGGFTGAIRYESTFLTSLILDSLSSLEEDLKVKRIKEQAASFLLTQKSPHW